MIISQGIRKKSAYIAVCTCLTLFYFAFQALVVYGAGHEAVPIDLHQSPAAMACGFPATVGTVSALNEAIDCYSAEAAGTYTISLSADISLVTSTHTISNTAAGAELIIDGAGFNLDGGGTSGVRLLEVLTDTHVTVQNITLTGGNSAIGAALLNYGDTTINNSTISGNIAATDGAAIYNWGDVTTTNTTISGNASPSAIINLGTLLARHATIVNNTDGTAFGGIGIQNEIGGTLGIANSIMANNPDVDCVNFGTLGTHTNNLIRNDSSVISGWACRNAGTDVLGSDPLLGALADNGGGANTHHPTGISSPIVGAASAAHCVAADQRGASRPAGSCDIGAVEAVLFSIADGSIVEGTGGTTVANVVVTRSDNALANSVEVASANGTALAGSDFTAVPATTLSFTAGGSLTQTIPVTIGTDNMVELDETFAMNLSSAVNGLIFDAVGAGTIINDDSATISIVSNESGDENSGPLTFDISLSVPVDVAVSVNFDTADGTATVVDSDYTTIANQTVTFPAGSSADQQVSVTLGGDSTIEPDESFNVSIDTLVNSSRDVELQGSVAIISRTGTIENDDTSNLTLSGGVAQDEGDGLLPTTYTFTATLGTALPSGFTVGYSTTDGTATTVDSDYNAKTGTLTFAGTANETQTFTVTVNADTNVEANETFQVKLDTVSGAYATSVVKVGSPHSATINNDDTAIVVLSGGISQDEGNSGTASYVFTGTLNVGVQGGFSVPIAVNDGTATAADGDYVDNDSTLTFTGSAGETQTLTVLVNGDAKVEANEQFSVTLGSPTGSSLIGSIDVSGTPQVAAIANDDTATISVTGGSSKLEGDSGVVTHTFTIELDQPVQGGFTLPYTTNDGSASAADGDYQDNDGSLIFTGTANEQKVVNVLANGDIVVEPNETFTFQLGTLTGTDLDNDITVPGTAYVSTIADDGDTASVTLSGAVAINEGNSGTSGYVFNVTLDNAVQDGFNLAYSTAGGSATSPNDFVNQSGTLNFDGTMGEVQPITITVNGDLIVEPNESFTLSLGAFSGTALPVSINGASFIEGMITNDDGAVFTLSLDSPTVVEGNTTVIATVSLNVASTFQTEVDYTVIGLTATVGSDFSATSGTLIFAPGDLEKMFSIPILNDGTSESDETLSVELDNAVNATLGIPSSAILTIIDDEGLPTVGFNQAAYSVVENGSSTPVTVTLNRPSSVAVTVQLQSVDGSAEAPGDYQVMNQSVVIPAGMMNTVVDFVPTNDSIYERDESLTLVLNGFINADPSTITETVVSILEDDTAPTFSVEDTSTLETEGLTQMVFTVELSQAAAVDLSVSYSTQDGTALVADGDYLAASGIVSIPEGQTSGTIEVTVNGDARGEDDETFSLVLSTPSDGQLSSLVSASTATGLIINDDRYSIRLPLVNNGKTPGPDLIVSQVSTNNGEVAITIKNNGTVSVIGSFWVDLFVNPTILPEKPNDTVDSLGQQGIVWLINGGGLPLAPSASITLSVGDSFYRPGETNFSGNIPAGTSLAVHVDSAKVGTDYGAIEEGHEIINGLYNNIYVSTVSADIIIP